MRRFVRTLCWMSMLLSATTFASTSPPHHITTAQVVLRIGTKVGKYMHYKPKGLCFWMTWTHLGPVYTQTPIIDMHQPDLLVMVYNQKGDNPYWEASHILDQAAWQAGNAVMRQAYTHATGPMTNGKIPLSSSNHSGLALISKYVDVIGSPSISRYISVAVLPSNTTPLAPYYLSMLDKAAGDAGEALRTEDVDMVGHIIGQDFLHKWGYEFPRVMTVANPNDFKASLILAQRAADLVTNQHVSHVVTRGTSNRCGQHCGVANVIEETDDSHEIWQEIYPNNHYVHPGQAGGVPGADLGIEDERAGNGNYVFVVWRHYKGCRDGGQNLLTATSSSWPVVHR